MKKRKVILTAFLILVSALLVACSGDAAPTAEIAADFSLPDSKGNMVNLADELAENEQVVLVFYYGWSCAPCMNQLREIASDYAKYEEKGAKVIAIAVQSLNLAYASKGKSEAPYPVFADTDHGVFKAFGVYDTLPEDFGRATPSVFIISQDREITWKHINESVYEDGEEVYTTCGDERIFSKVILENLS